MFIAATRNESKSRIQQLRWQDRRALRPGGDPRPRPLCRSEAGTARFHRREGRSEGHRQEQARRGIEGASFPGGEGKIVYILYQSFHQTLVRHGCRHKIYSKFVQFEAFAFSIEMDEEYLFPLKIIKM